LTTAPPCSYHGAKSGFLSENIRENGLPISPDGPQESMGRMKRTCSRTGFSLVELIVVIVLISIMSAFAIPVWQNYSANTNLKAAAREVMADLSNAKQRAVEENLDVYRLTFNVVGNSYALSRTDTGVTSWTKSVASFGNGISIDGASPPIVSFRKRGTLSPGNVVLRNGIGSTATITVNITGRTYVQFVMQ
jgi:prepilin-type N-terminal cleavage/methylation domain-containing protein